MTFLKVRSAISILFSFVNLLAIKILNLYFNNNPSNLLTLRVSRFEGFVKPSISMKIGKISGIIFRFGNSFFIESDITSLTTLIPFALGIINLEISTLILFKNDRLKYGLKKSVWI